ncbi:adenosine receptor A3-like [Lingula anatina]|uniref:Adenosine receptor A3-like n=1 Tax=Lingula anatina TaxID=7574 RepID=A0A1S3IIE2_LINAN|nr:adenosine receptor A3-like [Lingula anatina]|eukprot:XP_013397651.1 adenosine receptor A3-like [Lingula anatina]
MSEIPGQLSEIFNSTGISYRKSVYKMENVTLEEEEDFGNLTLNESKASTETRSCIGLTCIPFVTVEVILALATIIGNGLFILAFVRFEKLRKQSNYLLISLSVVDLLTGLTVIPIFIISGYLMDNVPALRYLSSEKYFCIGKVSIGVGVMFVSFSHQLLIAVERYVKICRSTLYITMFSKKRLVIIIILAWIYGIAINLPPLFGWNNWSPGKECRAIHVQQQHVQYVIIPHEPICILAVFGLYMAIFSHVLRHRKRMKKHAANNKKKRVKNVHRQSSTSEDNEGISETPIACTSVTTLDLSVSSKGDISSVPNTDQTTCFREESHGGGGASDKAEERIHSSKSPIQASRSAKPAGRSLNQMEIKLAKMTAVVLQYTYFI